MNSKVIIALIAIAFIVACNDTANQSSTSADSSITTDRNNTTVSPGTSDSLKNNMQDSAMQHVDSTPMNKR